MINHNHFYPRINISSYFLTQIRYKIYVCKKLLSKKPFQLFLPPITTTKEEEKETILTLFPRAMFPNESCRERNEK